MWLAYLLEYMLAYLLAFMLAYAREAGGRHIWGVWGVELPVKKNKNESIAKLD